VYGIVNNHGGYVGVESEPGWHGIHHLSARIRAGCLIRSIPSGSPDKAVFRVLLVDDGGHDPRCGFRDAFRLGYHVMKAKGGNEALEWYSTHRDSVDLVILDMIMPDLGGRGVLPPEGNEPRVKVILSSGYTLDAQAKEIMARGCNGFIQKPFKLQDISRKIQEVLTSG
jgi:CheY-like chemotaxis protein